MKLKAETIIIIDYSLRLTITLKERRNKMKTVTIYYNEEVLVDNEYCYEEVLINVINIFFRKNKLYFVIDNDTNDNKMTVYHIDIADVDRIEEEDQD